MFFEDVEMGSLTKVAVICSDVQLKYKELLVFSFIFLEYKGHQRINESFGTRHRNIIIISQSTMEFSFLRTNMDTSNKDEVAKFTLSLSESSSSFLFNRSYLCGFLDRKGGFIELQID